VRLTQLAEALFDASPDPLVLTDGAGTIEWVNRRFAEASERSPKHLEGRSIEELVQGADEALKRFRSSDTVSQVGRIRRKRGVSHELTMRATKSGRRKPTSILWWMVGRRVNNPLEVVESRPKNRKVDSPPSSSVHLDALRVLHELAVAETPSDLKVASAK
jgi:PAS domain S-box-containing protein